MFTSGGALLGQITAISVSGRGEGGLAVIRI